MNILTPAIALNFHAADTESAIEKMNFLSVTIQKAERRSYKQSREENVYSQRQM